MCQTGQHGHVQVRECQQLCGVWLDEEHMFGSTIQAVRCVYDQAASDKEGSSVVKVSRSGSFWALMPGYTHVVSRVRCRDRCITGHRDTRQQCGQ